MSSLIVLLIGLLLTACKDNPVNAPNVSSDHLLTQALIGTWQDVSYGPFRRVKYLADGTFTDSIIFHYNLDSAIFLYTGKYSITNRLLEKHDIQQVVWSQIDNWKAQYSLFTFESLIIIQDSLIGKSVYRLNSVSGSGTQLWDKWEMINEVIYPRQDLPNIIHTVNERRLYSFIKDSSKYIMQVDYPDNPGLSMWADSGKVEYSPPYLKYDYDPYGSTEVIICSGKMFWYDSTYSTFMKRIK